MKEQERKGIAFGFYVVFIWLIFVTGLTIYLTCATINSGRINKTIILPPPIVEPEFEIIGDYGYDL